MENWQLTLVILASIFVGALIPCLIMIAISFYRAGRAVAEFGERASQTLTRIDAVAARLEELSRGFKGGEADIADLLASVGNLARGLERNMKMINVVSAILASVGPVVAAYVKTHFPADEAGRSDPPGNTAAPESRPPASPAAEAPETARTDRQQVSANDRIRS